MIKNLDAIGEQLGMKAGEFQTFIDSKDEIEVKLDDIAIVKKSDHEILSKTDYAARIANLEQAKYNEGKTAQEEIINKNLAKTFGLEITGEKAKKVDLDYFKNAISTKILSDAKIEPSAKIKELESDKERALGMVKDWETKYQTLEGSTAAEKRQSKIDNTIFLALPNIKNPTVKTKIPASDMALLFKNKYNPQVNEDGKTILHDEAGKPLKNDKTLDFKTIDEVMADFQTGYLETPAGGGGGGDNPGPGKAGSLEAFDKEMAAKEITVSSKAYNDEMMKRVADKTLVI